MDESTNTEQQLQGQRKKPGRKPKSEHNHSIELSKLTDQQQSDRDNNNRQFITPKEVAKILKVSSFTLTRWADDGKIDFIKTPYGSRLYDIKSLKSEGVSKVLDIKKDNKKSYAYCRVSTHGQSEDLERQIKFMQGQYPLHIIVSDIGSGINYKRKGLTTILDDVFDGNVKEVVVAYKDRLCRFGYELFEWFFAKHKVRLVVLNEDVHTDPNEELTRDLLSIINVFSARINGRRKYNTKKNQSKDEGQEKVRESSTTAKEADKHSDNEENKT